MSEQTARCGHVDRHCEQKTTGRGLKGAGGGGWPLLRITTFLLRLQKLSRHLITDDYFGKDKTVWQILTSKMK